jgi:hypothetical protein
MAYQITDPAPFMPRGF